VPSSAFESPGSWLRCALHAHTTNSDGALPPDKLVSHYEWAGFDVLAITDHWVRTVEPSTDRLLVIPGAELDARIDGKGDARVLAFGLNVDPQLPETDPLSLDEATDWVADAGGVAFLAHTYWSGLRTEAFEACEGLAQDVRVTESEVEVRCSPARSITLLTGRMKGSSVNTGRLGYTIRSEILESDDRGLVTAARLEKPAFTPYGRLELRDDDGRRAWTNPLWVS
jgi:hypothetical protein